MNIKLKRKLSLILICVFCLSSFVFSTYASEHWALDIASNLADKGIVNGYADGSFGLDNNILRAEFVSIINRTFGFLEVSGENFYDVSEDKWYFKDMHIGKTQGYITGDDLGKSNPENSITRAEAAVILARILKLDTSDANSDIKDIEKIPNWSKGHICALVKEGIINGYPDGEFKADNTLTRGEGFSLINKIIDFKQSEELEEQPDVIEPQSPSASGSSMGNIKVNTGTSSGGFGGGGGGGGGNATPPLRIVGTPVLRYNSDGGYLISWATCPGAQSYSVKLRFSDENLGEVVTQTNNHSIDVEDFCRQYSNTRNNAEEKIYVSVKGNAMPGWNDTNSYSGEVMVTVNFESIDAPMLSSRYGKANNIERAIIDWNEVSNASGYEVKLLVNDVEKTMGTDYIYDSIKREVIIPDLSITDGNTYLEVTALSANAAEYKNSQVIKEKIKFPEAIGRIQDGLTKETAWIIETSEDFALIGIEDSKYLLSHHYIITKDITVTKPIGDDTHIFTGSITGKKNMTGYKPVVTLDIKTGEEKKSAGLVAHMTEGEISNLELKGEIYLPYTMDAGNSAPRGVGAVCGVMNGGIISNIINRAKVDCNTGTRNNFTVTGGIVGHSTKDKNSNIINCVNYGTVDGNRIVGGIVGFGKKTNITNCENHGTVGNTISGYEVGGIAGRLGNGTVSQCTNTGIVSTSNQNCGGILGGAKPEFGKVIVSECFNKGTVNGSNQIGGIIGTVVDQKGSTTQVVVSDCFMSGSFQKKASKGAIIADVGHANYLNTVVMTNCYTTVELPLIANNINDSNSITVGENDKISNYFIGDSSDNFGNAITLDELKMLLTTDTSFDSSKWQILSDFDYPQLNNNPYTKTVEITPEITNFSKVYSQGNLIFSWELPDLATEVKITVKNNTQIKILKENVSLPSSALSTYTIENANEGEWYEIIIEVSFADLESISETFETQAQ